MNYGKMCCRVCFCKCDRDFLLILPPFEFISAKCRILLFYQINFLMVIRAPEIAVHKTTAVSIVFYSFGSHIIFPQHTHIRSRGGQIEIAYKGVAYAVVIKYPAATFGYFLFLSFCCIPCGYILQTLYSTDLNNAQPYFC